jgi:ribulose-phosphate 3-epimerase
MTEVIPAILTDDPAELERFMKALKDAGAMRVHLDIMDDTLVPGRSINSEHVLQLITYNLELPLDIHLMVSRPDEYIPRWDGIHEVERFIVHVESEADLDQVSSECRKRDRQCWAAINPDTPLDALTMFSGHLDGAMCMTVVPGSQGREFRSDVLDRIRHLHTSRPTLPIMADGGITPTTAPLCVAVGASHLVSGSFVVKSTDPAQALQQLSASLR